MGKVAKGLARSRFPHASATSEWLFWLRSCGRSLAVFAGNFPGLDARFGGHGAVPEPLGLVARLHDVAVVGEPIEQCRRHLGINKHG